MTTESDIHSFLTGQLSQIKSPGYSTIEIEARKGLTGITYKATAYNEHSGIHRGDTIFEAVKAANDAYKPLHEQFMDTAAKLREQADSIEAKAKALIENQTPAIL